MKQCKTILIFLLLALTWLALFYLTGSRTPWQIFAKNESGAAHTISLGDMAGRQYDRMGFDGGEVRYVKSDKGWLVGTVNGELLHFDSDGEELWRHSVGGGQIRGIAVSQDEKVVYVGEKSPDGRVYAMDVKNGDILWQFDGASVLGYEADIQAEPTAIHISTDKEGNAYVVFYRYTLDKEGKRSYLSRIISFTPGGAERWRYPAEGNMDVWVNCGDVTDATGRFAFATANYDKEKEKKASFKYRDNVYVLDSAGGSLIHAIEIPPTERFGTTTIRNGLSYSADGEHLVAMASDGRGFFMDKDANILWERTISKVMEVGGSWYFAAGRDALFDGDQVLFATINTFNRENWQLPSPVLHPSGNSLFAFRKDGTYLFRYTAPAEIEETAVAGGVAALAVGRNVRNHDYKAHGVSVVSLKDGTLLNEYHTAGPLQTLAISDDGHRIAGIELPAVTPEGNLIGAYRLHLWER